MSEFIESAKEWLKEKVTSPIYVTFIIFYVVWNWKFFQIIFLEDASLFSSPRLEYIITELSFQLTNIETSYQSINTILNSKFADPIISFTWHIGPPIAFTLLAIIFLPIIHKWALGYYLVGRFDRKKVFEIEKGKYEEWVVRSEENRIARYRKLADIKDEELKIQKKVRSIQARGGLADKQLTDAQAESILSLLSSFGAEQMTIDDVEVALRGKSRK